MIYLSTNGEVLGQFEESEVPGMLASGKITSAAYYWREGMADWLPLSDLPKPEPKPVAADPAAVAGASAAALRAPSEPAASSSTGKGGAARIFLPRTDSVAASSKASKTAPSVGAVASGVVLPKLVPLGGAKPFVVQRQTAAPAKTGTTKIAEDAAPSAAPEASASLVAAAQRSPVPDAAASTAAPVSPKVATPDGAQAIVPSAATEVAPKNVGEKIKAPFLAAKQPRAVAASPTPSRPPATSAPQQVSGKKRFPWLPALAALLLVAAAAGGAWWWVNAKPSAIPGVVALAGDEVGPPEIRVFRREDLAAPWREKLAAADARAADLEKLIVEAKSAHREKTILYDEAAGVCAAGEEYNMPDVAELRADRDAKKAAVDEAKAALDKLQSESQSLLSLDGLLESVPAPLQTIVADPSGNFLLPPPESGEVVLLATTVAGKDEGRVKRGWLEVLAVGEGGALPAQLRFAEGNKLGVTEIRDFSKTAGTP